MVYLVDLISTFDLIISGDFAQFVNFPTGILGCLVLFLWISFFFWLYMFGSDFSILEILILFLSLFPLLSFKHKGRCFFSLSRVLLVLIGMVYGSSKICPIDWCICNCFQVFFIGPGWKWCMFSSPTISGQVSYI